MINLPDDTIRCNKTELNYLTITNISERLSYSTVANPMAIYLNICIFTPNDLSRDYFRYDWSYTLSTQISQLYLSTEMLSGYC